MLHTEENLVADSISQAGVKYQTPNERTFGKPVLTVQIITLFLISLGGPLKFELQLLLKY